MFKSRGRAEDAKGRKRTMVTAACSVTGLVIGQSTYAGGDDLARVFEDTKKITTKNEEEKKSQRTKLLKLTRVTVLALK